MFIAVVGCSAVFNVWTFRVESRDEGYVASPLQTVSLRTQEETRNVQKQKYSAARAQLAT